MDHHEKTAELSAASGIWDHVVLSHLVQSDIDADTLAALSLAPLVIVAWADGGIGAKERKAILAAAEEKGIAPDTPARDRLENWLKREPGEELLETWKSYVDGLSKLLSARGIRALRDDILERARAVAESAGGFLGMGKKISAAELAALDELERAFPT